MADLIMDEGEWATAAIDLSGHDAPWDDLAGAVVMLSATGPQGQAMTPVSGLLDPPGADGKIHSAYAVIPKEWKAGRYNPCTMEVAKLDGGGNPTTGWPQKQNFDLQIRPVAKKPAP